MKKLRLDSFGVQELSKKEMKNIEGGSEWGYWIGYHYTKICEAVAETLMSIAGIEEK